MIPAFCALPPTTTQRVLPRIANMIKANKEYDTQPCTITLRAPNENKKENKETEQRLREMKEGV